MHASWPLVRLRRYKLLVRRPDYHLPTHSQDRSLTTTNDLPFSSAHIITNTPVSRFRSTFIPSSQHVTLPRVHTLIILPPTATISNPPHTQQLNTIHHSPSLTISQSRTVTTNRMPPCQTRRRIPPLYGYKEVPFSLKPTIRLPTASLFVSPHHHHCYHHPRSRLQVPDSRFQASLQPRHFDAQSPLLPWTLDGHGLPLVSDSFQGFIALDSRLHTTVLMSRCSSRSQSPRTRTRTQASSPPLLCSCSRCPEIMDALALCGAGLPTT